MKRLIALVAAFVLTLVIVAPVSALSHYPAPTYRYEFTCRGFLDAFTSKTDAFQATQIAAAGWTGTVAEFYALDPHVQCEWLWR